MGRFEDWLGVLSNRETAGEMKYDGSKACRDMGFTHPDELLDLVERDANSASNCILKYVVSERDRVSGATLDNRVNAVKQFLGFYDLRGLIAWGKIKVAKPKRRKVAGDRPPSKEEIRALLAECDSRMRFYVLACASGGARRGWTDYATVRDLTSVRVNNGGGVLEFGRLVVYRGEPEEYVTFITPEAWLAWLAYRKDREDIGEVVTPKSPLIRDSWTRRYYLKGKRNGEKADRVGSKTLGNNLLELWWRAKIPDPSSPTGVRYVRAPIKGDMGEFKTVHGLRKHFETQCKAARLYAQDVEVLKGAKFSYHKPSEDYLIEEYVKALPYLTVSEAEEVRQKQKKTEDLETKLLSALQRIEMLERKLPV